MNRTKRFLVVFIGMCLAFINISCDEEEEESSERSNISGTLTYQGKNFSMKGGLLDEKSDSTLYRTTYEFKVADLPIRQSIRKVFEIYQSSAESLSVGFKLTTRLSDEVIETGTYFYSPVKIDSADFPAGLILHETHIFVGTGNSTSNHSVTGGQITIEGTFPDYTLTFSLTTKEGNMTGTASGVFITRESYNDFFNAN